MEITSTYSLLFVFVSASVTLAMIVHDNNFEIDFKLTKTTQCMESQRARSVSFGASLGQCVLDCVAMSDCLALNFRRQFPLCELFVSADGAFENNSPRTGPCVYISKDDMTMTGAVAVCNCQEGKICDTVTNRCVTPVCPLCTIENGTIFGNRNEVGSRIMYSCDTNYTAENEVEDFATCQADERWTHYPRCLRDCNVPADHPKSTVTPGKNTEGTTRSYSCADKYRFSVDSTITNTTCERNGEWTSADFKCVADYRYKGCYKDYSNNRIFKDVVFSSSDLTPDFCVEKCFHLGFIYAYTESYRWCHCGNQTSHEHRMPDSDCNTACIGDQTSNCGGTWRASLFVRNTDLNYLGCYKDFTSNRILDEGVVITWQMNTSLCLDFCRSNEKRYALTQYSRECYCGNTVLTVEKTADNQCNMPCIGNELEYCGGPNRGSIFTTG